VETVELEMIRPGLPREKVAAAVKGALVILRTNSAGQRHPTPKAEVEMEVEDSAMKIHERPAGSEATGSAAGTAAVRWAMAPEIWRPAANLTRVPDPNLVEPRVAETSP